jgi:hypothetical protein
MVSAANFRFSCDNAFLMFNYPNSRNEAQGNGL